MHAQTIIAKILKDTVAPLHRGRRDALIACVNSALNGQALSVTALGRRLNTGIDEKHQIKRVDRLLSNRHLHGERVSIYASLAQQLLARCPRPVIAVDWSDLDGAKRHFLLRASLLLDGRSLTLIEAVHGLAEKDKPRSHQQLLDHLQTFMPANARPVLVTDAGFRTPWFKQVRAMGWDYVGRVRNRHLVSDNAGQTWFDAKTLYAKASVTPKEMGAFELTRRNPLSVRLVVVRQPKRGRSKQTLCGQRARSAHSKRQAAREREPWLLVTSLSTRSARPQRVVSIYARRMQIEEAFRDLKSARYGLGFDVSCSYTTQRIAVLLLVALLALYVAWVIGTCVERCNQQRRYQANTERRRRVLSIVYLGRRALQDKRLRLDAQSLAAADEHRLALARNAFINP